MKKLYISIGIIILLSIGFFFYIRLNSKKDIPISQYETIAESDPYVRFDMEAFDIISKNYWKLASSSDYATLFQLSLQKAQNSPIIPTLLTKDRIGTANMLANAMKDATSTNAKKQLAINTLNVALYNLAPIGRNELLSSGQEIAFRQNVTNINSTHDLYSDLGLIKGTSTIAINDAYKKKQREFAKATTSASQIEFARIQYAHIVLSNERNKAIYDQLQIEPTVFTHVIGSTLYFNIDKISPNTIQEFMQAVLDASTTPNLSSMIIDLRGNIGGDLSFPQYFLGLFIGQNQYAFDLFHQGNYQVERTVAAHFKELDRYVERAILTDKMTQSTAELTTASMKRFHLAYSIGSTTRGWGSVENTYPMHTQIDANEKYSLLLVNSLTLGEDNQPIESTGVTPTIDISSPDWKKKLSLYFSSKQLIKAIETVVEKKPIL